MGPDVKFALKIDKILDGYCKRIESSLKGIERGIFYPGIVEKTGLMLGGRSADFHLRLDKFSTYPQSLGKVLRTYVPHTRIV